MSDYDFSNHMGTQLIINYYIVVIVIVGICMEQYLMQVFSLYLLINQQAIIHSYIHSCQWYGMACIFQKSPCNPMV
jgi:hypothetical protein